MSEKSDKIQSHKKKTEKKSGESRKYAQIPFDSVVVMQEMYGQDCALHEDASQQLAEDVSYRLREVIHNCCVMMRQSKRKKLTTADVNSVFQTSDVPAIYGHVRAEEPLNLVYVPDANVFAPEEEEVDLAALALNDEAYIQRGEPFVKCDWLNPDPPVDVSEHSETVETEDVKLTTSNSEKPITVPPHLDTYYTLFAKIVLGGSDKLLKVVHKDLQTNSKIAPIFPYFINMLTLALSKLPRGKAGYFHRHRFLKTIDVLTSNSYVDPTAYITVDQLIDVVTKCVLDPTLIEGVSPNSNYELRETAALVLAKIVNCWCSSDPKLHLDVIQKLGSALLDGSSSLRSHYTALRTLCLLGHEALDYCLWPHLEQYLAFVEVLRLQQAMNSVASWCWQNADIVAIEGAILDAAEMLYRKTWDSLEVHTAVPQSISILMAQLDVYFGDSLCARWPIFSVPTHEGNGVVNVPNSTAMEVDMLMKDTSTSDFELDYRNWTAIAKIPIHVPSLFMSSNRHQPNALLDRRLSAASSSRMLAIAFELPVKQEQFSTTIHFNFAGANPVSKRRLRRRRPDHRHAQFLCASDYLRLSCQAGCVGKSMRKQQKGSVPKLCLSDIMAVL